MLELAIMLIPTGADALGTTRAALAPLVLDTVNDKIGALQATIRGAVVVVAIVLFLLVTVRSRLRLAPTLLALLGAASVIWLAAGGGLEWFAGLLGREFALGDVPDASVLRSLASLVRER